MSSTLNSHISLQGNYLRAANVESTKSQSNYVVTGRASEVLRRLADSFTDSAAGRAWSLTGPYGAGKSSFALNLCSLVGDDDEARRAAERALADADQELLDTFVEARDELSGADGFVVATTTCQQEPVGDSVLRALVRGVEAKWGKDAPDGVSEALDEAEMTGVARDIAAAARAVCDAAPTLLVLDEFGKTLEYFSAHASESLEASADLFVLQELAEMASSGAPLFTFTLQHLAFDDYVRQASLQQRREWSKVQGRFEGISFLESASQSIRLIASAFHNTEQSSIGPRRKRWAKGMFEDITNLGLGNKIPGGQGTVEQCYPLHPVSLMALPELSARLGQHGRTLYSFLGGTEPGTARSFLEDTEVPKRGALPSLTVDLLFDFFTTSGQSMALAIGGPKWREIVERVEEASSLSAPERRVLKVVGVLNLVGPSTGLTASQRLIACALDDGSGEPADFWLKQLEALEESGFVTYRDFADEYRLWQGTDVDMQGKVRDVREHLRTVSTEKLMRMLGRQEPVVAGHHSQRTGMLRYFDVAYSDDSTKAPLSCDAESDADGLLVYHLGSPDTVSVLKTSADPRPVVVVSSARASAAHDAAVEVVAALNVLDDRAVFHDRVASRELSERAAAAESRLNVVMNDAFTGDDVTYTIIGEAHMVAAATPPSLSRLLSEVCDVAYPDSPVVGNEMIARRELSTQGARARRLLIEHMIENGKVERLGIDTFGPERAVYEALLNSTGIHGFVDGEWVFKAPRENDTLSAVWRALGNAVNNEGDGSVSVADVFAELRKPPYGLHEGPAPILLTAYLLANKDDVAIYEEGSYVPSLTTDLMERLMKAPKRFDVRSFTADPATSAILEAIAKASRTARLGGSKSSALGDMRNGTLLAVSAPLLRFARSLPGYVVNANHFSKEATRVRDALLEAREPDRLVLEELPAACGISLPGGVVPNANLIGEFEDVLARCLLEMKTAYGAELKRIARELSEAFTAPVDVTEMRDVLGERVGPLEGKVTDPKLRAFIFNVADTSLDNAGWVSRVALALSGKTVELWKPSDREVFESALATVREQFLRLEALHFDLRDYEDGVVAHRMTITSPGGVEHSRVVCYDQDQEERLGGLVDDLLEKAEAKAGAAGAEAVAAMVLARIAGNNAETTDDD